MSVNLSKNDFRQTFSQAGAAVQFFLSVRGSGFGAKKSLSDGQKGFDILNSFKLESDLSSRICGMELAPYNAFSATGCQGFTGPLPSAFLDKIFLKELVQR